jgi:hypothetical protein
MLRAAELRPTGHEPDWRALRDHLIARIAETPLQTDPFCHIYVEGIFPASLYPALLQNLPPREAYTPFNLRRYGRANGESTRDMFYLSADYLEKVPVDLARFWNAIVRAMTASELRRAVFAKLAPDLAERFGMPIERVPDIECNYEIVLVRDTEDYRIKPHPDGANKIVTMQFYLPPDDTTLDLGTSLYRMHKRRIFGRRFEEVKRFPFKPNSAYAFPVSHPRRPKSWHGRDRLTGFTGVRNTLMLLFQHESPRRYAM